MRRRLFSWLLGFVLAGWTSAHLRAGTVVISELMYHPPSTNVLEEWLELYNPGPSSVDLTGWRLSQGVHFTFPDHTTIPANQFLVVAANGPTFQTLHPGVANFVAGWEGTLSDDGDHVALEDAAGNVVSELRYAPNGDWAIRRIGAPDQYGKSGWEWYAAHDGLGSSLELINPALPIAYAHNWSSSTSPGGTPGQPNSVTSANTAPLIFDVGHFPPIPKPSDTVTVQARVLDEHPTGLTVTLHWRLDGPNTFTSVPMFDDGAHQDGLPNDGLFAAQLPARAEGTIVEFYLVASDAEGHARTYPAVLPSGNARTANLLYQVDSEAVGAAQPLYRLIMSQAEYDYLKGVWSSQPDSDAESNGTFIGVDALVESGTTIQVRYNASFRNRGHGTRTSVPHNFRVDFPKDRLWQNRQGINLNTQFTPAQVIGSVVMRRARLPMAESRPVQVRINGQDLAAAGSPQYGAYAANELVDSGIPSRQIPDDPKGNLYRGIRDVYPGNPKADLAWHGPAFTSYTNAYFKQNHTDANDWSDLVNLISVLNNTPDASYVSAIRQVANVDEWMRYFAANTLLGNQETALGTGYGDDYALYRGVADPRFQLLPYDMDSVLGKGTRSTTYADGLFRMYGEGNHFMPAVERFVKHPEFAPIYYRELLALADKVFEPAELNPVLDQLRSQFAQGPEIDGAVASMKAFNESQLAYVRAQIPLSLSVSSTLTTQNGFPHTTSSSLTLNGRANAVETRSIRVNGLSARWSAWEAGWSISGVTLHPGVNAVLIQSFDAQDRELERLAYDVWYDDGTTASVPTSLSGNTTWSASGGPYTITSTVTIGSGATLTIQAGTSVYLSAGASLIVANGGRLIAEGTEEAPIRFTRPPGSSASWNGIVISGAAGSPETRLSHVILDSNGTTAIEVAGGTVFFEYLTFGTTTHQYIALDGASFVLSHCVFPTSTAPFELVHGTQGIKSGGHGIIQNCYFGNTSGYNDIIDFTGGNRATQPIIHFLNNVFVGASDDILDLDNTDAWIEGNIFLHAHKNGTPDSSSAISGGNDTGQPSEITIIGNLFYDCDQAATGKEGNFYVFLNNTVVHQTHEGGLDTEGAVVNLADEGKVEGSGMYLEGNVLYDIEQLTRNVTASHVTFTNNFLSLPWSGVGGGNHYEDPLLTYLPRLSETYFTNWEQAQVLWKWFSLADGSPARSDGPNVQDSGVGLPLGATLSGQASGTNASTSATILVGSNRTGYSIPTSGWPQGAGYTHYRWRLDSGAWSGTQPISEPIVLSNLATGSHDLEVSGQRDSGLFQDDPLFGELAQVTRLHWVVDPSYVPPVVPALRLNEVLAKNVATFTSGETTPDLVELYNSGSVTLHLAGLGLSDDPALPHKFTFPDNTDLAPGAFLVLVGDHETNLPGLHLGFALKQEGDSVYLYDRADKGSTLIDGISFGSQIADYSVGRRADGSWGLCLPTFGSANRAQRTGNPAQLRINEWLANARFVSKDDFVELFNGDAAPVALAGLFLTDAPGTPARNPLPALSFIGAGQCLSLIADGDEPTRPGHLNFKLAAESGLIQLSTADLVPIDTISYGPQRTDFSQGRTPSGGTSFSFFPVPTPGALNPGSTGGTTNITYTGVNLIPFNGTWRYQATGTDLGTAWQASDFNDASWKSGVAPLGVETSTPYPYPFPIATALPLTTGSGTHIKTYYFRAHFNVPAELIGSSLYATNYLDDGAVYYLNGHRVGAIRVSDNPATYDSNATLQPNEGEAEVLPLPNDHLVAGNNVLAVEVHQSGSTSTDVVFSLALGAVRAVTNSVSGSAVPVVLNEVFTQNATRTNASGEVSAWVELYNPSTNAVSLTGLSLTTDSNTPRQWVFGANTSLASHGFLRINYDALHPSSDANTGVALAPLGGTVYLFDRPEHGGGALDAVSYGIQTVDYAIGRVPDGTGEWVLTIPSENTNNVASALGTPAALRLNEWMADPAAGPDWFELYNSDALPVALSGLSVTDDLSNRTKSTFPPLSFIGSGRHGFVQIFADKKPAAGANHADFKLSKSGSALGVYAISGAQLDALEFGPQATGASEGRLPDGSETFVRFPSSPTPNAPNTSVIVDLDTDQDGMPDAWEDAHGLNKLVNDAALDLDADGFSNLDEYLAGTDPQNPSSNLEVVATHANGIVTLSFTAIRGRSYTAQYRAELQNQDWQSLKQVPAPAQDSPVSITDPSASETKRFYRILTPAVP